MIAAAKRVGMSWIGVFLLSALLGSCASSPKPKHKSIPKSKSTSKPKSNHSGVAKAKAKSLSPRKGSRNQEKPRIGGGSTRQGQSDGDLAATAPDLPPDIPLTTSAEQEVPTAPAVPAGCTAFLRPDIAKIRYLPNLQVFFTGLFDSCPKPHQGYRKGFFWLGMGVPCTGGEGRIQVVGKSSFPKKVVFRLDNACPMALSAGRANQPHIAHMLGFPSTSKLLALYPLDTIYWHFSGTAAAGIGNDVTIHRGHLAIWNKVHGGRKVPLRIVGRENSFKPSGKLFEVEAMLSRGGSPSSFVLEIARAAVLTEAQAERVVKECRIRLRSNSLRDECLGLASPQ